MSLSINKADVGVVAYLLAAVMFFIIPIPSFLLDAVSICGSLPFMRS